MLTDAWMKGIRTFDKDKALEAMLNQTRARSEEISSVGRDGYAEYDRLGYVPYPEVHEATPRLWNMLMLTGAWHVLRKRRDHRK